MNPRDADTYLSEAEIERLTGRHYPKVQCRVLAAGDWPFSVDADGRPLVLRAVHDKRMGLDLDSAAGRARKRRPRLAGLAA